MSFDIYSAITERIIQQLEQGLIPWEKPWTGIKGGAYSATTGRPYSLLNQMLLGKAGAWYTISEATRRGGRVRKGEKGSMVVFWKQIPVTEFSDDETQAPTVKYIPMLRYFTVFHASQCDGLPEEIAVEAGEQAKNPDAEKVIHEYISRESLAIEHRAGDQAYYSPSRDCVVLPLREQFADIAEYYSTAFHELTHSTGHATRLNRLAATAHFGDAEYSWEELTAEIGAAALMNYTGAETAKAFRNSAAYIQNWLTALRNDRRMIVRASGAASKAINYILAGA